ncbi:alpha/beta-hydrolase [Saccharata proteae CBS 121410]|uniref:Alpha/beta-hydrolase n=1 Tax=Saccharata proteae CBS 121410 TaxID=1314787 RepID=A0A9P4M1Z2_9PEZI|nr:alpha/beta-hydrolase [Saccharata proteae CBS 121410]
MAVFTTQPLKGIYTLFAVALELVRMPMWMAVFLVPRMRPVTQWTYNQAVRHKLLRAIVYHSAVVEVHVPLSMKPGKEGDRFTIIEPAAVSYYQGPLADPTTRPSKIGGTWYPSPYSGGADPKDEDVVLHFHGGAFVLGDGRDKDAGHLAHGLLKNAGVKRVFCPQYRLAGPPTSARYPAQLQDAVTAYNYLVNTLNIPANRIVVSGDSAGGNIANGLLRYIAQYGRETSLPSPTCAWMWSPWINPVIAMDADKMLRSPNYPTDYLSVGFGVWGCRRYCSHCDPNEPYISGGETPFLTETPIWMQTSGREVLYHDCIEYIEAMSKVKGNVTKYIVVEHAPHDIALMGHVVGFEKEFAEAAQQAGEFLREKRAE